MKNKQDNRPGWDVNFLEKSGWQKELNRLADETDPVMAVNRIEEQLTATERAGRKPGRQTQPQKSRPRWRLWVGIASSVTAAALVCVFVLPTLMGGGLKLGGINLDFRGGQDELAAPGATNAEMGTIVTTKPNQTKPEGQADTNATAGTTVRVTATTSPGSASEVGGGGLPYSNYINSFGGFTGNFDLKLIEKKGQAFFDNWCQANQTLFAAKNEAYTDARLVWKAIKDFGITRQEYYDSMLVNQAEYGYTKEMADAIYDHDTVTIKRLFVNPQVAFFNEQDKEIYGLRELSSMTLQQAKAVGIQKEAVRALLAQWDAVTENNEETDGKRGVAGLMIDFNHIRSLYQQL